MNLAAALIALFIVLWPAVPAEAAQRVSVQLNWKHQFEFAAFYAAEAQGYYRQAGLEVTIREGGPGIDTTQEVATGRADFGIGTSSLVAERYRGAPVVAIATLMQHSPIGLLALRRNGIRSVHDLAGRPVAVDAHNRDEIKAYLLAAGIPRERIRLVDQIDWTLDSLNEGKVAAKVVYVSNEPYWIRDREHEYLLLTPRSAGIDLFGNMLFANAAVVAARPETVKAFRAATLKGLVHALDHPEQMVDLILARYNSQNKSRDHLLFEAAQMRELTRHDIVEPGYMSPGRWRHVVDVLAGQGQLPRDFDLADFIYDTTPQKTPLWLIWTLAGLLLVLAATVLVALKLRGLNQRLRREMRVRARAEVALARSEEKYRELVDNANAIVLRMDVDGTVTYFNEFAERFFGYTAQEIIGRHVVGTIVPERETATDRDLADMVDAILAHPEDFEHNENENMTRDGRRVWVRWANKVMLDAHGRPSGVSCFGQDITESRQAQELIRAMAFYDTLTALPNRRLLLDRLHQALALSARNACYGALLFIDLDKFKELNDAHGHAIGDRLLVEVARRLQACVREGDTVARLAGDEFVVMLEELELGHDGATRQAGIVAGKIVEQLGQPYRFGAIEHRASASVGIAMFYNREPNADELIKRADMAMYRAKTAGRNTWQFFDEIKSTAGT